MSEFLYGFATGWAVNYTGLGSLILGIVIGIMIDKNQVQTVVQNDFFQKFIQKIKDGFREKAS